MKLPKELITKILKLKPLMAHVVCIFFLSILYFYAGPLSVSHDSFCFHFLNIFPATCHLLTGRLFGFTCLPGNSSIESGQS